MDCRKGAVKLGVQGLCALLLFSFLSSASVSPVSADEGSTVRFVGKTLTVNNESYFIKGVGYSPIPIGFLMGYDFFKDSKIYERDFQILRVMGCNTIRVWKKVTDRGFLDAAYNNGVNPIRVIMGFPIDANADLSSASIRNYYLEEFRDYVEEFKDHPAVLMWCVGNEVNLNRQNDPEKLREWYSFLNEMAGVAHEVEGANYHPVTTSEAEILQLGESDYLSDDASMTNLDAWGVAIYQGETDLSNTFEQYATKSSKPLWISEFGVDAYNNNLGREDEEMQALYDGLIWDSIESHSETVFGGCVMEYSDEWHKIGNPDEHDLGGYELSGGPDGYLNEEWWGMMRVVDNGPGPDIMIPRKVYNTLREKWGGIPSAPVLSEGSVRVDNIGGSLNFTFFVTYSDLDDDEPAYVRVHINGSSYDMVEENQEDDRFADGKIYTASVSLPSGSYSYYFEASDGTNVVTSEELSTSGSVSAAPSSLIPIATVVGVGVVLGLLWYFGILQKLIFKPAPPKTKGKRKSRSS